MPVEMLGQSPLASDRQVRPFSPATRAGDFVFVSGQVPVDDGGQVVVGGIEAQTRQVFRNIEKVLALAGCTLEDVCKVGDKMWVKCIGIDDRGRIKLSRKEAMRDLDQQKQNG